MDEILCDRVTGTSALSTSPSGRRIGKQRRDGRWEVLCQYRAVYLVGGRPACDRDLASIVDAALDGGADTVTVRRPT